MSKSSMNDYAPLACCGGIIGHREDCDARPVHVVFTPKQLRSLRRCLQDNHSTSGRELLALVVDAMGGQPANR